MPRPITIEGFPPPASGYALKRTFDLAVVALVALPVLVVLIVSTVAVLVDTGRPVIFGQARIGRGGREFRVLKLRTMRIGSEHDLTGHSAVAADPRVTRVGRVLRSYKLDELPQLINVVRGEMSIVGPRPTVRSDYARMTRHQRARCALRPGITGLAQVSGNTSLAWPDRIELDLEYARSASLLLDLSILLRTVRNLLRREIDTVPGGANEWNFAPRGTADEKDP